MVNSIGYSDLYKLSLDHLIKIPVNTIGLKLTQISGQWAHSGDINVVEVLGGHYDGPDTFETRIGAIHLATARYKHGAALQGFLTSGALEALVPCVPVLALVRDLSLLDPDRQPTRRAQLGMLLLEAPTAVWLRLFDEIPLSAQKL